MGMGAGMEGRIPNSSNSNFAVQSAAQARAVQSNWETMQRLAAVPAVAVTLAIAACTLQGCEESTLDCDGHGMTALVW